VVTHFFFACYALKFYYTLSVLYKIKQLLKNCFKKVGMGFSTSDFHTAGSHILATPSLNSTQFSVTWRVKLWYGMWYRRQYHRSDLLLPSC